MNGGITWIGDRVGGELLMRPIEILFEIPDHIAGSLDTSRAGSTGTEKPHDVAGPHLIGTKKGSDIHVCAVLMRSCRLAIVHFGRLHYFNFFILYP